MFGGTACGECVEGVVIMGQASGTTKDGEAGGGGWVSAVLRGASWLVGVVGKREEGAFSTPLAGDTDGIWME